MLSQPKKTASISMSLLRIVPSSLPASESYGQVAPESRPRQLGRESQTIENELPNTVRKIREAMEVTQGRLGTLFGYEYTTISKIETGQRITKNNRIYRFCEEQGLLNHPTAKKISAVAEILSARLERNSSEPSLAVEAENESENPQEKESHKKDYFLPETLLALRKKVHMSQKKMAAVIGCHYLNVSFGEKYQRSFSSGSKNRVYSFLKEQGLLNHPSKRKISAAAKRILNNKAENPKGSKGRKHSKSNSDDPDYTQSNRAKKASRRSNQRASAESPSSGREQIQSTDREDRSPSVEIPSATVERAPSAEIPSIAVDNRSPSVEIPSATVDIRSPSVEISTAVDEDRMPSERPPSFALPENSLNDPSTFLDLMLASHSGIYMSILPGAFFPPMATNSVENPFRYSFPQLPPPDENGMSILPENSLPAPAGNSEQNPSVNSQPRSASPGEETMLLFSNPLFSSAPPENHFEGSGHSVPISPVPFVHEAPFDQFE